MDLKSDNESIEYQQMIGILLNMLHWSLFMTNRARLEMNFQGLPVCIIPLIKLIILSLMNYLFQVLKGIKLCCLSLEKADKHIIT